MIRPHDSVIVHTLARVFTPIIQLFALYVLVHGHHSPGGGFQAGVIFAAAFVLYGLVFGVEAAKRVAHPAILQWCVAIGLLIYAGTGMAGILLGGNFLDYGVLDSHDPVHGQHLGILLVELGVGMTVAAVMLTAFLCFAGRRPS